MLNLQQDDETHNQFPHIGRRMVATLMVFALLLTTSGYQTAEAMEREITIVENNESHTITTTADNVGELIAEGYIGMGNFDKISQELDAEVEDGMVIEIDRAIVVLVEEAGRNQFQTFTLEEIQSVESTLEINQEAEFSVEITNLRGEPIIFSVDQFNAVHFESDMPVTLSISTVEEVVEVEQIVDDIVVERVYTENLASGEQAVHQEGQGTVHERTVTRTYVNGELSESSETLELLSQGTPEVLHIGTRRYLERFTASVTAYYADCEGCIGLTACSGFDVRNTIHFNDSEFGQVRVVAFDRRLPCGSIIYIEGIGHSIVMDRGGAVTGVVIDLLVNGGAFQFGRQAREARVLRHGF